MLSRRALLTAAAGAPWAACTRGEGPHYTGGWVGAQHERGHRLRELKSGTLPEPALQRRVGVVIVGAGIAGLAAARSLNQAGIDDVHVFDLEDAAGGNSRGHVMAGMACPLGAHYLPLPGERAEELIALLEELGLRSMRGSEPVYDERHLCHSPQERLFIAGQWHEGLLPPIEALPAAQRAATLAQYRQFSAAVTLASQGGAFSLPTARSPWSPALGRLDAVTFAQWLDVQGLHAPALRWYLDYCCRDDYGAGAAQVSAWAGLHYFASRHGFHAPGDDAGADTNAYPAAYPAADAAADAKARDGVLTWPEGNAWLSLRLAAPLSDRLHTGMVALGVNEGRHEVSVDLWNAALHRAERWTAPQVVLAVPLFVAARLLAAPPAALAQAVSQMRHAPWLVANLHLDRPLLDLGGAPPSWDNVLYAPQAQPASDTAGPAQGSVVQAATQSPFALGYVDAMHQSTRPHPGPTVLTAYWALGGDSAEHLQLQRARLLNEPWSAWAQAVLQDLAPAHPDLAAKVKQVDLTRYGHAMSVPLPGIRSSAALRALAAAAGRVHFAHSDLAGYSVFEEAFFHGHSAGLRLVRAGRSTV
jgi:predicted NAD/FAD-dependent oxidoreductase